jgi:uncharacterized protein (DUF1778 family)
MRQTPPPLAALGLTADEAALITKAAAREGRTPAEFLRLAALDRANKVADMPVREPRSRDSWDVRQMKKRLSKKPDLKLLNGGKE